MLRILHCADLHLDSPFRSEDIKTAEVRRKELRGTLSRLIMYIKDKKIELCLMAGDMFDKKYVTRDTAAFFSSCLASAPDCRFVIAAGNHDPFTENGVYGQTDFSSNVYIFKDASLSKFSFPDLGVDVYGYSFTESTLDHCPFRDKTPDNTSVINILCAHGDVGNPISVYCPITEKDIADAGFDYCAFGHIHNSAGLKTAGNSYYAYSGCVEGRDFGETGHKGALYVEVAKSQELVVVKANPVMLSQRRYEDQSLDITGAPDTDTVLGNIRKFMAQNKFGSDTLLRLTLRGSVSPSLKLDVKYLSERLSQYVFYFELIDCTVPLFDAASLESDQSVRGEFFRELLPALNSGSDEERSVAAKALRIGLAAIAGEDFTV